MENITLFVYEIGSATNEMARLRSGFLLKEILEHFMQKLNSTQSDRPDRLYSDDINFWLYSGHDFTISNLLRSLDLFKVFIMPYFILHLYFDTVGIKRIPTPMFRAHLARFITISFLTIITKNVIFTATCTTICVELTFRIVQNE